MKNAESRENERGDKFPGAAESMRYRGWIQKEDPGFTTSVPRALRETAPGKLRQTIRRFIAAHAVIVFP